MSERKELMEMLFNDIVKRNKTTSLNKDQACRELGVGLTKLNELLSSGELRFKKVGKQYRVNALTIAELLL